MQNRGFYLLDMKWHASFDRFQEQEEEEEE